MELAVWPTVPMPSTITIIVGITIFLVTWNFLVIQVFSKFFYSFSKRFQGVPSEYVGRKIVHILGGGVTTIFVPRLYEGYYWVVVISAFLLAAYVEVRRRWRMMYWFQVEENAYEVHFAVAYGAILALGVLLRNIWISLILIPMLFMSFGGFATGLVRAFTKRCQVKSCDGTLAMFLVCVFIGMWKLGWYGVPLALAARLVEKIPRLDDNVTVPLASAALVYLRTPVTF